MNNLPIVVEVKDELIFRDGVIMRGDIGIIDGFHEYDENMYSITFYLIRGKNKVTELKQVIYKSHFEKYLNLIL